MDFSELRGLTRIPLLMLRSVEGLGVDAGEVLADSGIARERLSDPDARIPVRLIVGLWRTLIERLPGRPLGLELGAAATARDFGLVGYTMAHSSTLGKALDRLARYVGIISEAIQLEILPAGPDVQLCFSGHPALDTLEHPVDARMAAIVAIARELTGSRMAPKAVRLTHGLGAHAADHRRFYQAPIDTGPGTVELLFDRHDLDRPVTSADTTLVNYLDEMVMLKMPADRHGTSLPLLVRQALWTQLATGRPSLQETSIELGMSVRTLQRRLADEGTSFFEVLQVLRRELATELLQDERLAVHEVAFLLGYSEASAFHRAFRSWTGTSPQRHRLATSAQRH